MIIFLSLRLTADAEGGLKGPAQLRRSLQGFGGDQPPTSTRRVYPSALLANLSFRFCFQSASSHWRSPLPWQLWSVRSTQQSGMSD